MLTRARTSIVSCAVGPRDLELDDLGAEVVGVAVQPDLGRQPDAELVAALAAVAVRLDPQRVEVVDDLGVVVVFGQVADREVHLGPLATRYRWTAASAAIAK